MQSQEENTQDSLEIRASQLDLLFEQSYPAAYISLLVAVVLSMLLWPVQLHGMIGFWMGAILFTGFIRIALFREYRRNPPIPSRVPKWERAYLLAMLGYFSTWGLGCVWLMPTESVLYQVLIIYFLIGMAGSAVSVFSAHRLILLGAVSALLLPALAWFYSRGDLLSTGIALACTAFYVSSIRSSKVLSHTMQQNLKLNILLREAKTQAEQLARIDELTGVNNRRAFYEVGEQLSAQSLRNDTPLTAILVDVDYFKRINDQYGHNVGDRALRHVAENLGKALRGTDICGRVGGEEFAVLLPNTSLEEASKVAEKLRLSLQESPLELGNLVLNMTASYGVAQRQYDLQTLVHDADAALYRAKSNGRNGVELAVPDNRRDRLILNAL